MLDDDFSNLSDSEAADNYNLSSMDAILGELMQGYGGQNEQVNQSQELI